MKLALFSLLLLFLIQTTKSQSSWTVANIQLLNGIVDQQTDLAWTLKSRAPISQNDCIQFEVSNPYGRDPDPTHYKSFVGDDQLVDCSIVDEPNIECKALNSYRFQIKFTGQIQGSSTKNTILIGQTSGKPFKNPYSARRLSSVTVTHFFQCDVTQVPIVRQTVQISGLQVARMPDESVQIESSSQKVGVSNAVLTIDFSPQTTMKKIGKLIVKSPAKYQKASILQEGNQDQYTGSMVSEFTEPTLMYNSVIQVQIDDYRFQYSTNTIVISYTADRDLLPTDTITLTLTDFSNPLEIGPLVKGFQVTTTDRMGFQIDQSSNQLALKTEMTEPATLDQIQVRMLGDRNGLYEGMIVTLQTFEFVIGLNFPLQPFCYFALEFPQNLRLEDNVISVQGSGIFQPTQEKTEMTSGTFGQYSVDPVKNTIVVEGCRMSEFLTENPFGTFRIRSVRMPNYIDTVKPVKIKVYSDITQSNLIIDDPNGAAINMEELIPGLFTAEQFKPSNQYASAQKVGYTLHVRPQHTLPVGSRVVIDMPELLTFDRQAGCQVLLTNANCTIDDQKNTLTLTDMFESDFIGGTLLKFMILSATNPLGSRPAGPWAIRSEILIDGQYYVVDGQAYEESFYALSGTILTKLQLNNYQVSNRNTKYTFTINTEHNIPINGKLQIQFPEETPDLLPDQIKVSKSFQVESITSKNVTINITEAHDSDNEIKLTIEGVQNVRSLQPSSSFVIRTMDPQYFVIDQGGQDVIVQCQEPATFTSVQVTPLNQTNGAITPLKVEIELEHALEDGDSLIIELPNGITFNENKNVTCAPNSTLIEEITCSNSGQQLTIELVRVNQTQPKVLTVIVSSLVNPTSFKKSETFKTIHTVDNLGFMSQSAASISELFLQTTEQAIIQDWFVKQDSEDYGDETRMILQFETQNPIGKDGVIVLKWSENITLFSDTFCKVVTHKQIWKSNLCEFKRKSRELIIRHAFEEVPPSYTGTVQITLSRIRNPQTNEMLKPYVLQTFNDQKMKEPIDRLEFQPLLICHWPCFKCGLQKDYCTACWREDLTYLFSYEAKSTCLPNCPHGWTSNGTQPQVCTQCDFTCDTCHDNGQPNDIQRCMSCKPEYSFRQQIIADVGFYCLAGCNTGFYDAGDKICQRCALNCGSCEGTRNKCTSCKAESSVPVLFGEKCITACPGDHTAVFGQCQKCKSPCASCENLTDLCTRCDGTMGREYLFGPDCIDDCPMGTTKNFVHKTCEGCITGCEICDYKNPRICQQCQVGYFKFRSECVTACPDGYILTFEQDSCRALSEMDTRVIYFPFLICTILILITSAIGKVIKPKHKVLVNFLIMMGLIEHIAIIVQFALTFVFSTYIMAILIGVIWALYSITLLVFNVLWYILIVRKDARFRLYMKHSSNVWSSRVRTVLGLFLNWRFHKLLYSHFFGIHVNTFLFTDGEAVGKLMFRINLSNILLTYLPLLIVNCVGLATTNWGTQLSILWIENIVIALIMLVCSLIEHRQMVQNFLDKDEHYANMVSTKRQVKGKALKIKFMPVPNALQHSHRLNFLTRKMDQLIELFGSRHCTSDVDLEQVRRKERDPRIVRSFPGSPQLEPVDVDDPPRPLREPLINNCYAESFFTKGRKMVPLDGKGLHKRVQVGGPFDGSDMQREDAFILSLDDDKELYQKAKKLKARGRKNRHTMEVDRLDAKHGAVLDGDMNGSLINQKIRAEYLASIREEDDEVLKKSKIIKKTLNKSATKSSFSGATTPRKANQSQSATKLSKLKQSPSNSLFSAEMGKLGDQSTARGKSPRKPQPQKKLKVPLDDRTFNENEILGNVNRDANGYVLVNYDVSGGCYRDLDGRKVTQMGYLLDEDNHIVSNQDANTKLFCYLTGDDLSIPAPHAFERFNFNAFDILGSYKKYDNIKDCSTCVKGKAIDKHVFIDDHKHEVTPQGFLMNAKGSIVNQKGRIVLDRKQLSQGQKMPSLYNWTGVKFQLFDVMGVFRRDEKTGKIINEDWRDLSGHLVNPKGYLVNSGGDIVNRDGIILFSSRELKSGEFPKIFKFSKLDFSCIQGKFDRQPDNKPKLFEFPDGTMRDKQGHITTAKGYLCDEHGNITDKQGNIFFEAHLLSNDGRLPLLFSNGKLLNRNPNEIDDDRFSELLQEIEDDLNVSTNIAQDQTIQDLENSTSRLMQKHMANRTFNNQSPQKLVPDDMSSDNQSISPSRRKQLQKGGIKYVKKEKLYKKDVAMANVYGGEAQPRVRMIPKRFKSNVRERGQVLRESSILSPSQMMHDSQSRQNGSALDIRTRTAIEQRMTPQAMDVVSTGRESNMAKSIHNFQHMRQQMMNQPQKGLREDELGAKIDPSEYQGEMNRLMDGFNYQLQSMGEFSDKISVGRETELATMPPEGLTKQLLNKKNDKS